MRERGRAADDDAELSLGRRSSARTRRSPAPARASSPRPGSSCRRARRAARATASSPTSTTGSCCSRTTRCAASPPTRAAAGGRALRGDRAPRCASSASQLTRRGIRRGASEVDRLLTGSAAKSIALVEVVGCEYDARGERAARARAVRRRARAGAPRRRARRRARPGRRAPRPQAVLRARRRRPHGAAAAAARLRPRPALRRATTPRRCSRRCERTPRDRFDGWRVGGRATTALVALAARGAEWMPRLWVELATRVVRRRRRRRRWSARARCSARAGTARCVNCLVDLTRRHHRRLGARRCAAARCGSTPPTRTRSRRTGTSSASRPTSPAAAPTTSASCASTCTCSRPSEDGEIEAGPSHVHPALGPFAPPPASRLRRDQPRRCARRAAEHERARERWRIGEPYRRRGAARRSSCGRAPAGRRRRADVRDAAGLPVDQRVPFGVARPRRRSPRSAAGRTRRRRAAARRRSRSCRRRSAGPRSRLARAQTRAPGRAAARPRRARASATPTASSASSPTRPRRRWTIEPRASGYLRCVAQRRRRRRRASASRARSTSWSSRPDSPRYLVSRLVPTPRAAPLGAARRACSRAGRRSSGAGSRCRPTSAGDKERAEAFARAWRRWLGPGRARVHAAQRGGQGRPRRRGRRGERLPGRATPHLAVARTNLRSTGRVTFAA